jgi:hypothetical protein
MTEQARSFGDEIQPQCKLKMGMNTTSGLLMIIIGLLPCTSRRPRMKPLSLINSTGHGQELSKTLSKSKPFELTEGANI